MTMQIDFASEAALIESSIGENVDMNEQRHFTIRGAWPIPFDMFRYDECYPASESQSAILETLSRDTTDAGVVEIEMITRSPARSIPTRKRWESFCWKVL